MTPGDQEREFLPVIRQRYAGDHNIETVFGILDRYRSALHKIIELDHHNMGPESRATRLARDALTGTVTRLPCS